MWVLHHNLSGCNVPNVADTNGDLLAAIEDSFGTFESLKQIC